MRSETFEVTTGSTLVTDLTGYVERFVAGAGDGLVHVFVPHATAGAALIETGSGSESDLATVIDRLAPAEDVYRHRHGSTGHGRDHVLPAFIAPSLTIPVIDGRLALGTWQSVVLVDPNIDNTTRSFRLTFLSDT